jgi:predicted phosphodiesterase
VTTSRLDPARRVAVLADVLGNVAALRAVLAEVSACDVDLITFTGDLTWGPQPQETVDAVRRLGDRAIFVRGNADRAVVELTRGVRAAETRRETWMVAQHSEEAVEFLASFSVAVTIGIVGLGSVRLCHGLPQQDADLLTPAAPSWRFHDLAAGVYERLIVTPHTHVQSDREVGRRRSVNPGSVGLPYRYGNPGTAYWALLGPDVEFRQTRYDVDEAVRACATSGDPGGELMAQLLLEPASDRGGDWSCRAHVP